MSHHGNRKVTKIGAFFLQDYGYSTQTSWQSILHYILELEEQRISALEESLIESSNQTF